MTREWVERLQQNYDCHEFDEMLEECERNNDTDRPLFYIFALGKMLATNLK